MALSIALLIASCDSSESIDPIAPLPEPDRITESFSGSFGQQGESFHSFETVELGNTEMVITALDPLATLTVGLGIGSPNDGAETCIRFASDDSVRIGAVLLVGGQPAGPYCVVIYDVGNVFADQEVTYTVEVTHP